MKTKQKKEPVKASNIFMCITCNDGKEMSQEEVKAHLRDAHKLTELKGKRSMTMHLDGADYFASTYEWDIQGVKLAQSTINPRSKNDMMRFA